MASWTHAFGNFLEFPRRFPIWTMWFLISTKNEQRRLLTHDITYCCEFDCFTMFMLKTCPYLPLHLVEPVVLVSINVHANVDSQYSAPWYTIGLF